MTNEESKQIIAATKATIKFLSDTQDSVFENAKQKLNLPDNMEEWFFDYIFNEHDESVSFDDYLSNFKQGSYHNELQYNNMNELINDVIKWFYAKGIIENSNPLKQLEKTQEELTETRDAVVKLEHFNSEFYESLGKIGNERHNLHEEIKDGIGDTVVTLIGVCEMYGFTLEECLQQAYDVISKRSGEMINGKFVKDTEA
jgi:NTP pyrophosphatase (non-canonical NTP hydrolase)